MKFSPANAREMAAKSAEARRAKHANELIATATASQTSAIEAAQATSQYAYELMRAQSELLAELRSSESAKDKAALSQAIKNLREAWHMETGAPKPGTIKPERTSSRARMSPRPPEPEPIDPSTLSQ